MPLQTAGLDVSCYLDENCNYVFKPKEDITAYELALCLDFMNKCTLYNSIVKVTAAWEALGKATKHFEAVVFDNEKGHFVPYKQEKKHHK